MTTHKFYDDDLDLSKIRWADVNGVRTRYYEAGQGEPLVLIHGGDIAFVDALDTWSRILPPCRAASTYSR